MNKSQKKIPSNPFFAVVGGFGELFGSLVGVGTPKETKNNSNQRSRKEEFHLGLDLAKKESLAKTVSYGYYKIYKKAHKMLAW